MKTYTSILFILFLSFLIFSWSPIGSYAKSYDFDLTFFNSYEKLLRPEWTLKYHSINESRVHFIFKKTGSKEEVAISIYDLKSNENAKKEWERKLEAHLLLESQPINKYKITANRKEGYFETKGPGHDGRFYVTGQFFSFIHVFDPSYSNTLPEFYRLYENTFNE